MQQLDGALAALVVPASRLEHEPPRQRLATGLDTLDAQLGGGWPAAALSEIAGKRSAGRTSVVYASLAAAMQRAQAVALVDAAGVFDPRSAEAAGVVLSRLLWVRAVGGRTVLQAAELLVAAGGFGLVVVDLGERPGRVPDAAWLRLRHAAERQRTAVLVAAPWRMVGATAATAVVMHAAQPRFVMAGQPLLVALETRATVERSHRHHQQALVTSPLPANAQLMCFSANTNAAQEEVPPLAASGPTTRVTGTATRTATPTATAMASAMAKPVASVRPRAR